MVGRDSGEVRLEVVARADGATLEEVVECATLEGAMVYTDEWKGYNGLPGLRRGHATVSHAGPGGSGRGTTTATASARSTSTRWRAWTGLRNFLRPFRGVSKQYLGQYVAIFQWGHEIKRVTDEFLRILLGMRPGTGPAS